MVNISQKLQLPLQEALTPVDTAFILISNVVALLSCCGCLVIIAYYVAFKGIRTTSRLLLVCLSVADFFVSFSTLLQTTTYYKNIAFPSQSNLLCQTSAGLLVYSQICAALWTVAITFYLFMCITCHYVTLANRIFILYHIGCWLMPLIVTLSSDLSGVFGYDVNDILKYHHPTACWISDNVTNPLPWYFLTVEGWVIATFLTVSFLYIPITWSVLRQKNKGKEISGDDVIEELAIQTANQQLRFIPAIYICTRIWGTGYFFFTRYPEDIHMRASDWLMIIKAIGDNSQGLANAILFSWVTREVRKDMANRLLCFTRWCRRQKVINRQRFMKVPFIVSARVNVHRRSKNLDGSNLDISGISLDFPVPLEELGAEEDEVIFEK